MWSDELAEALVAAGARATDVAGLRSSEVAISVPDGEDPIAWGALALGIDVERETPTNGCEPAAPGAD